MIDVFKNLALAAVINLTAADALLAQNYILSPGDSIVAEVPFNDLTVFNILQNNLLTDTLWLSYQKVSAEVPPGWEALFCDNANCYPNLKDNGEMLPVVAGEYGLMSIHITPQFISGTALIRYDLWETKNPALHDTLTWIISSGLTAVEVQTSTIFSVLLSDEQLIIQHPYDSHIKATMMNMEGKITFERKLHSPNSIIDVSEFSPGIYLIVLQGEKEYGVHKILLK